MLVSFAGLTGALCQVTWLYRIYQVVMFPLIVLGISFTIFTLAVTNKGPGEAVSGRGYKEYRLGDYSNWLQKRVTNENNWNKIKSCLTDSKVCTDFHDKYLNTSVNDFYKNQLYSVQSVCCKSPTGCQFDYSVLTNRMRGAAESTNPDCNMLDNNLDTLCFNCQSCKAVFIDFLRSQGKMLSHLTIDFLVVVLIFYLVEYYFRNTRDEYYYLPTSKPQCP